MMNQNLEEDQILVSPEEFLIHFLQIEFEFDLPNSNFVAEWLRKGFPLALQLLEPDGERF